jgi:AraC-like DNA-binding protein
VKTNLQVLTNTRLAGVQNWTELAEKANWSVAQMASLSSVSIYTLKRHFLESFGKNPKKWIIEQRQIKALELLKSGASVKETSFQLGYSHQSTFSREFKKYWNYSPSGTLFAIGRNRHIDEKATAAPKWLHYSCLQTAK